MTTSCEIIQATATAAVLAPGNSNSNSNSNRQQAKKAAIFLGPF
jgi:hypothetical protein